MREWYLYIIRCADGSLYTGITVDVARRLAEHDGADKGAKYLRGRQPLELVYQVAAGDHSTAAQLEHRLKQLSSTQKRQLVNKQPTLSILLELLC